MKFGFLIIGIILASTSLLHAQSISPSVMASGGGYASAGGYSLGYIVCEMTAIGELQGANSILTQGFFQPEDFINQVPDVKVLQQNQFLLYPNPAQSSTSLVANLATESKMKISVTDVNGNLIAENFFQHVGTGKQILPIVLTSLSSGVYFVSIDLNGTITTLKLCKL